MKLSKSIHQHDHINYSHQLIQSTHFAIPIQPKRKILYNLIHPLHKIKFNYRVSARKIQLYMLPIFHIEKIDIPIFDQYY